MASPPLLDFAALTGAIPGDNPAGSSIPFEIRARLEEGRKEDNPDDYAPDDPMRPEQFKKADWPGIVRLAQETLTQTSKDLLVASRLTEALVKQHGFAGLRDGLCLLRELAEQCWDRLHPPIEDGDLEIRAGPFNWLDDPDHGARFPTTVRMVPLIFGEKEHYCWLDWRLSHENRGRVSREELDKAIRSTPPERLATVQQDINQSLEEITKLTKYLADKMGPVAPGLTGLRQAVEECRNLVQQVVQQCPVSAPETDKPIGEAGAVSGVAGPPTTRKEAYRQLAQAAGVLRGLEPHSPIPYLVERAVELGALPFPQLIRELVRDANILAELNRELGIKEQAPKE
jgi:type VI secretion system protein ImpA